MNNKISDQLLLFEEIMIFSTEQYHPLLSNSRQRQFYAKLRSGLFIKLSKMIFGGFYERVNSYVKGREPNRATSFNLACLYLTPPKFSCSFRALKNAVEKSDEPVFERNLSLLRNGNQEIFLEKAKGTLADFQILKILRFHLVYERGDVRF
jgi:hypothetical protein